MQSNLEVLTSRVNEIEERVNNIEDKLMARKEAEEKREKELKDHEKRLRELNDSLRRKNLRLIGVPEDAERDRGLESVFEQIIAGNFPNLGRETGIQIQKIERFPPTPMNEIETRRTVEQINKNRNWFSERINKIDKPLASLIKRQKRVKLIKSRMEKERSLPIPRKYKRF
uniref:L1 transposable element RRM domain-containing protein n=2 Tax=Canis lupus familiaris TaxID=9615 RepID=A0A8P0PP88_CANLF